MSTVTIKLVWTGYLVGDDVRVVEVVGVDGASAVACDEAWAPPSLA